MSTCPDFNHLLILPHLRVQNANAISSPLTHGFPSMTAFLGLMWALERKVGDLGLGLKFKAIGAVCHDYQEQVTEGGFTKAFRLTRNPLNASGGTAAIVEEGRIHLDISLVLAVDMQSADSDAETLKRHAAAIAEILAGMRIAGGSLLPADRPWSYRYQSYFEDLTGTLQDREAIFRRVCMRLLPGFTLVSRDSRIEERMGKHHAENSDSPSRLDAWLSLSRINWHYEEEGKGKWLNDREGRGWTVPIPVGYGALGAVHPPGSVPNARDSETPFRFTESLYSIGEWVSPHRLRSPQQMLWYAESHPDRGIYRCQNDYEAKNDEESEVPTYIPHYHFD